MLGSRLEFAAAVLAMMAGMVVALGTRSAEAALVPTKASMLVTLRSSGATCGTSPWKALDTRVNPDGTLSPYVIPVGKVLVVTSVDWRQGAIAAGQHSEFFLFPSAANISVNFPIAQSVGAGAGPTGGGSFVVTGTAIGPGTPCWGINDLSNIGSADALVHGFLAPDK